MNTTGSVCSRLQQYILNLNRSYVALSKLSGVAIPDGIWFISVTEVPTFKVHSLEQLHTVRAWLREHLGEWEDELGTIWYSGDMLAEYVGKKHRINIWLSTPPEEFPLQTERCKVVKEVYKPEAKDLVTYSWVCNKDVEK